MPGSMTSDIDDTMVVRINDGEVPIRRRYQVQEATGRLAPLEKWAANRASTAPPYRPRFMVYSGLGTPDMTRQRFRILQDLGAESFLLAADLPSQLGFDPDHELAHAQVGRAGVSCATLADLHHICADLDLSATDSIGMLANSVGHVGLGMVTAVLDDRNAQNVKLVMQNDPLKEFTARGTEIFTPEQALRIACDCVAYAIDQGMPGWPMTVCSNHFDVAGAGPLLAAALAFANAIEYVDELVERGYNIRDVASRLMFFLNERSDLFVEASIFLTARVIWSEILRARYALPVDEQPSMTLMGYAHGLETSEEPLVNIARCTLSVAASVLGGVDYLCAASYDEALRIPSVDAAALSLRTMQVVGMEHGIALTVAPLAGSSKLSDVDEYVYSTVTQELDRILENGGGVKGIHNGYIARRIDEGRGTREQKLAHAERPWVGVNTLQAPQHRALFVGRSGGEIDFEHVERSSVARVEDHRRRRNEVVANRTLKDLEKVASSNANLLPVTVEALRAGATIQEITDATSTGFANGVQ